MTINGKRRKKLMKGGRGNFSISFQNITNGDKKEIKLMVDGSKKRKRKRDKYSQ